MDTKSKPTPWEPVARAAFASKCGTINALFNDIGLRRCELDFPQTGLCTSSAYALAHVKHSDHESEILVKPMKFVIHYDHKLGYRRYIEQQLTKPMQFNRGQIPGFSYEVSPKSDVKISRLIVDLKDLERATEELVAEANRFYLLYCYPY